MKVENNKKYNKNIFFLVTQSSKILYWEQIVNFLKVF